MGNLCVRSPKLALEPGSAMLSAIPGMMCAYISARVRKATQGSTRNILVSADDVHNSYTTRISICMVMKLCTNKDTRKMAMAAAPKRTARKAPLCQSRAIFVRGQHHTSRPEERGCCPHGPKPNSKISGRPESCVAFYCCVH